MTGAEMIFKTAADAGVEICFANPGTTELALVAALTQSKTSGLCWDSLKVSVPERPTAMGGSSKNRP